MEFIDCGLIVTNEQGPGNLLGGLPQRSISVGIFLWAGQFL